MARRRRRVRVGALNVLHKTTLRQQKIDLLKALKRGDSISLSEVGGPKGKALLAWARKRGYGTYRAKGANADSAIVFDRDKFELVKVGTEKLNELEGPTGGMRTRFAAFVLLRDKRTGKEFWQIAAHTTPPRQGPPGLRRRIRRQQYRTLARLARRLADSSGRPVIIAGDLNFRDPNVKGFDEAGERGGVMHVLWPGQDGGFNLVGTQIIKDTNLFSDHNAVFSTFTLGAQDPNEEIDDMLINGVTPPPGGNTQQPGSQPPASPPPPGENVANENLSAFKLFSNLLASWGIPIGEDIGTIIRTAVEDGITPDMIEMILPDIYATSSFKNRFPGWEKRVTNGYNQISVGEYLALENAYHRILQENGLPVGFYDQPSDFGNWIANNVSPDEIQGRVTAAMDLVRQVDPTARNLLTQFYGLGGGDLAAYFLDQKRALPTLERQYKAVNVAAFASRNGLRLADASYYESLVDQGITPDQAAEGYPMVRTLTDTFGQLGSIYGIGYSQMDAEGDVFFNRTDKRRKLAALESANFSGSSRGSTGSAQRGTSY